MYTFVSDVLLHFKFIYVTVMFGTLFGSSTSASNVINVYVIIGIHFIRVFLK